LPRTFVPACDRECPGGGPRVRVCGGEDVRSRVVWGLNVSVVHRISGQSLPAAVFARDDDGREIRPRRRCRAQITWPLTRNALGARQGLTPADVDHVVEVSSIRRSRRPVAAVSIRCSPRYSLDAAEASMRVDSDEEPQ